MEPQYLRRQELEDTWPKGQSTAFLLTMNSLMLGHLGFTHEKLLVELTVVVHSMLSVCD